MKAVIQRVQRASVSVAGIKIAQIESGLAILLGVGPQDDEETARALAGKVARLRIFEDEQGKMNRSVIDRHGAVLVVSQFTLYADTRKGNRPSFTDAAPPEQANRLYQLFAQQLREQGLPTHTGEFGAHMVVEIINDGPVTIVMEMERAAG